MVHQPPMAAQEWAIQNPDGTVDLAHGLGEQWARAVVGEKGGVLLGPYTEGEARLVARLPRMSARDIRDDPEARALADRGELWSLLDRQARPDV